MTEALLLLAAAICVYAIAEAVGTFVFFAGLARLFQRSGSAVIRLLSGGQIRPDPSGPLAFYTGVAVTVGALVLLASV